MRKKDVLSLIFSLCFTLANSSVTIYNTPGQAALGQVGEATSTTSAVAADYTGAGLGAYDPTVLQPPAVPNPLPSMNFNIQLLSSGTTGMSIKQEGNFYGFSIEFSVITQVIGKNSTHIFPPFLNLMANIAARGGKVQVRVGGNTQETATLVDSLPNGRILEKDNNNTANPTDTPPTMFTPDVLYMLGNVSSLVNVEWYLGVPLNDSANLRLEIAEVGMRVLGDKLKGLQVGNEPDLYFRHNHRPEGYSPTNYDQEFGAVAAALEKDSSAPDKQLLIGPSIAMGDWTPEMVWDVGFATNHPELKMLSVEKYPTDNCWPQYQIGTFHPPQQVFSDFLNHTSGQSIVQPYLNSTAYAQTLGKPFIMFETNTASCGGFPGVSNSFGAALWALDYGLQMAYSNFSAALLHVGGQNVYYNPFTPPPTNVSTFRQWTIGAVYYSSLIMAEILGSSGNAQVLDLFANNADIFTPAYGIYENGAPTRLVLFNYITDPSGASTYTANINIGGGQTGQPNAVPASVKVKYFLSDSVAQINNFTWAGQTFGTTFASDGRLMGTEDVKTVNCDQNANTCAIQVPAPGVAVVFLTDDALKGSEGTTTATFATTAVTKLSNTATVDSLVLATSNGHGGSSWKLGSTSQGSSSGTAGLRDVLPKVTVCIGAIAIGAVALAAGGGAVW